VALVVGPVVGNAVRDASGLLSTGDFADSQHFNELATELNRLAEEGPVTDLRSSAEVGRTVEFVACGEIVGGRIRWPLKLIPVSATVE
jgi:predicted lipoprotein